MNTAFSIILCFVLLGVFLVYGLYNGFVIAPKQMDEILDSLNTNQTHVDSLTCDNIELAIASGNQQMLLNKPVKLIEKLKEIAKEKQCKFQRPDLWLDGYIPDNENLTQHFHDNVSLK